jgi:ribosomal protein S18 acetylase RimI-like enzyme
MFLKEMRGEETGVSRQAIPAAGGAVTVLPLSGEHEGEVLSFLAARPLHTVFLSGFIRDNGLVSELNRGTFYAARDRHGQLEGVALIGHATLIEARSEAAIEAFARFARGCPSAYMILGEGDKVTRFWNYYAKAGLKPRLICRELLLEKRWFVGEHKEVPGLRQATMNDLAHVLAVNAEMALEESGINPLEKDPIGFRLRWARRVEQGRVWLWVEGERLIFKADIMSETPDVIYLEGVYVNPGDRGKSYGLLCFSQLCRTLLARTASVCLLVNERNHAAQAFYRKAGYELRSQYDTIFLYQQEQ